MIRILHVLGNLNRGGAETMVMNLYRNIDRDKIQFDFIMHTKDACDYSDEVKSLGGKIYSIPRYTGKNHFQYKKAWNDFFKQHPEYKIIHGHVRSTASIYLKEAKKHGLITISHSHSTSSGNGLSAIIKNLLQHQIQHVADYLFACSKSAGLWLFGENACKNDNFYILNNAIDTKRFTFNKNIRAEKRSELSLEGKFVVGHVGRFHESKNHSFLIDIFKKIHDQNNNSILLMVGDGELRDNVEQKVKEFGLEDSVIFAGIRSDIPELIQAMDVFVFPSVYEGLPVTLIEAQSSGLPCFVADHITDEVEVTNLVTYISLNLPSGYWANIIESSYFQSFYFEANRTEMGDEVIKNGFGIKENSEWLEKFYLKLLKTNELSYAQ